MIKKNIKKFGMISILLSSIVLLIVSLVNIINWKKDSDSMKTQIKTIEKTITVEETNENAEAINPPDEDDDIYWKYMEMNLINVDFSKLKNINQDVKGWIQVNGTNINYPFVQTNNNKYYLTKSFNRSNNKGGWVFLDYRNSINNLDKNTIIYAHGRADSTMFGSLKNILKNDWYNDLNNHVIKISTETENTLWQVFSVYLIKTTNDYLKINFSSDNEYQEFLNLLKSRSTYEFNVTLNSNDKIITLSTCYNNSKKVVMHAKLVKKSSK